MSTKPNQVKRPNGLIYFFVYLFVYPFLKVYLGLKVDRKNYKKEKGPFILISNHASFIDFLLVMLPFYPRRLNSLVAQKFFLYKPLDKILPIVGCIPKNLFDPDVRSIAGIKEVLKRGDCVMMFPEGRCSTDGAYMGIHTSTGKLMKFFDVPVISCYVEGTYNCMPIWRNGLRCGRVRVTIANLFSTDDLHSLSVDEVTQAIDRRLSGADSSPPSKPLRVLRKKNLAEGLHNILYYCPKCKKEFTLDTKGNKITCASCGNTATLDRAAKLHPSSESIAPQTIHEWYREQAKYEMQFLSDGMKPLSTEVNVKMPAKTGVGIEFCGSGVLSLDPKGWLFEGKLWGESARLFFPIHIIPAIPFDPNDNFQIYANGSFYVFTPKDKSLCMKFATIGECAYWRFTPQVRMTPGFIRYPLL